MTKENIMKALLILLVLALPLPAFAADLTCTVPTAAVPRAVELCEELRLQMRVRTADWNNDVCASEFLRIGLRTGERASTKRAAQSTVRDTVNDADFEESYDSSVCNAESGDGRTTSTGTSATCEYGGGDQLAGDESARLPSCVDEEVNMAISFIDIFDAETTGVVRASFLWEVEVDGDNNANGLFWYWKDSTECDWCDEGGYVRADAVNNEFDCYSTDGSASDSDSGSYVEGTTYWVCIEFDIDNDITKAYRDAADGTPCSNEVCATASGGVSGEQIDGYHINAAYSDPACADYVWDNLKIEVVP